MVIIDDSMIDNEKSLTVTLHETPGMDDAITLTVVNGVINIFDGDGELIFLVCVYWFRCLSSTSQWLRCGLETTLS